MKRMILAILLILSLTLPCASAEVELYAVNVGKGDALILRAGGWVGLIDAGKPWAMGRVRAAMDDMGVDALDAVFLTHPDGDHAGGLTWLAESSIPVGAWYASSRFIEVKKKKHPAAVAAKARGQEVTWLERGDRIEIGDGVSLTVRAPLETFLDKDNNNSLVMMLESGDGRILLTGDMELPQEASLLIADDDLRCDILKVPNHADDDTVSAAFAEACAAELAVISTSTEEKRGTPDPGVVARLEAAGTNCVVTQDADLGLWATLAGGEASVVYRDVDAPLPEVVIESCDAGDDRIVLRADADADLSGCYLYSSRGDEYFTFADGASLQKGERLSIGSRATDGEIDLLWDEKRVIHKSKEDVITLYDRYGRAIDAFVCSGT